MGMPGPSSRASLSLMVIAAGAAVLCCAGPALLILAATGLGAVAVRSGAYRVGGVCLAAALGVAGLAWWRRQSCASAVAPDLHSSLRKSSNDDEVPVLSSRRT